MESPPGTGWSRPEDPTANTRWQKTHGAWRLEGNTRRPGELWRRTDSLTDTGVHARNESHGRPEWGVERSPRKPEHTCLQFADRRRCGIRKFNHPQRHRSTAVVPGNIKTTRRHRKPTLESTQEQRVITHTGREQLLTTQWGPESSEQHTPGGLRHLRIQGLQPRRRPCENRKESQLPPQRSGTPRPRHTHSLSPADAPDGMRGATAEDRTCGLQGK